MFLLLGIWSLASITHTLNIIEAFAPFVAVAMLLMAWLMIVYSKERDDYYDEDVPGVQDSTDRGNAL